MISELVREKIFHLTNQEIPYSIAVEVEHMVERGLEETEISEQENFVEEEGSTAELQENNQAMIDAFLNQPTQFRDKETLLIFCRWVERDSQRL